MPFSKLWFHISKGCKDKRDKGIQYELNHKDINTKCVLIIVSISLFYLNGTIMFRNV